MKKPRMENFCHNMEELSNKRQWDAVFVCLKINPNSTINIKHVQNLIIPNAEELGFQQYETITKVLTYILHAFLVIDSVLFVILLSYTLLFAQRLLNLFVDDCAHYLRNLSLKGKVQHIKKRNRNDGFKKIFN